MDDIFGMVVASPDDDAPRQIYADALLEAGDPLGDFIAIHFKLVRGEATPRDVVHLRELLRDHERAWIGDLVDVLCMRVYRAGFLERATLRDRRAYGMPPKEAWERATQHPRLGTLRALDPGTAIASHYTPFLFAPAMRNLREATVLSDRMLLDVCLAERTWNLASLVLACPLDGVLLASVASSKALASLEEVVFRAGPTQPLPSTLAAIAGWPQRRRFRTLSFVPPGLDGAYSPGLREIRDWVLEAQELGVERIGFWLPMSRGYLVRGRLEVEVRDDVTLAAALAALKGCGLEEVVIRPPPREACCRLESPRHLAFALDQLRLRHVEVPPTWDATLRRGY